MLSLIITMLIGLGIGIYTGKYIYQPKSVDFEDEQNKIDSSENAVISIVRIFPIGRLFFFMLSPSLSCLHPYLHFSLRCDGQDT